MSDPRPAKEVAQEALANRIFHEPGFLERLALDPTATAKPVLQELLGDDDRVDLSDVRIQVHFETEDVIHLVIPVEAPEPELDEVSGFNMGVAPMRFGAVTMATPHRMGADAHGCPACPHPCIGPL